MPGGIGHDLPAGLGAPGKGDFADPGVGDQRTADFGPESGNDVQNAWRQQRGHLAEGLHRRQRAELGDLHDHAVSRQKRRADFEATDDEEEVPLIVGDRLAANRHVRVKVHPATSSSIGNARRLGCAATCPIVLSYPRLNTLSYCWVTIHLRQASG